jgi:hypothetical protein
MSSKLSVEEVLAHLEQRAVSLREQEALHAKQESHHREQRALCAAELEKVQQSLEAFRQISATAVDLVRPLAAQARAAVQAQARAAVKDDEEELPPPGHRMVGRLIQIVIESPSLPEPFGPTAVAEEVNRRFASRLAEEITPRTASDVLRRLLAEGGVRRVRKGKAFYEALYQRVP